MTAGYVPLWVKSNYSFLEGASHPDELVEEAHRLGVPSPRTNAVSGRICVRSRRRLHSPYGGWAEVSVSNCR